MPGAFEASAEFDHDPLATAEEIQHSGENVLRWLEAVATSQSPWLVDLKLVQEIHFRWFETTFPADAGQFRTQMVLNRKEHCGRGRGDPSCRPGRLRELELEAGSLPQACSLSYATCGSRSSHGAPRSTDKSDCPPADVTRM